MRFCGIRPGENMVDIGSGYGNLGFYLGLNLDSSLFMGFEIVDERINEAKRIRDLFQMENVYFYNQDVTCPDFSLPLADYYYLYDPMVDEAQNRILNKFAQISEYHSFKLVVTPGNTKLLEKLFHIPWLRGERILRLLSPQREVYLFQSF